MRSRKKLKMQAYRQYKVRTMQAHQQKNKTGKELKMSSLIKAIAMFWALSYFFFG